MKFTATTINGLMISEFKAVGDTRGAFQRHFCATSFREAGLAFTPEQVSHSYNAQHGTLRGLHFQRPPHSETKHVRCIAGAVWDVAVDLRSDSVTYGQWLAQELSAENGFGLLIPKGFAHGFYTLTEGATLLYATDYPWTKAAEGGIRWDDPTLGIDWPGEPAVLSYRDRALGFLGRAAERNDIPS